MSRFLRKFSSWNEFERIVIFTAQINLFIFKCKPRKYRSSQRILNDAIKFTFIGQLSSTYYLKFWLYLKMKSKSNLILNWVIKRWNQTASKTYHKENSCRTNDLVTMQDKYMQIANFTFIWRIILSQKIFKNLNKNMNGWTDTPYRVNLI